VQKYGNYEDIRGKQADSICQYKICTKIILRLYYFMTYRKWICRNCLKYLLLIPTLITHIVYL